MHEPEEVVAEEEATKERLLRDLAKRPWLLREVARRLEEDEEDEVVHR